MRYIYTVTFLSVIFWRKFTYILLLHHNFYLSTFVKTKRYFYSGTLGNIQNITCYQKINK